MKSMASIPSSRHHVSSLLFFTTVDSLKVHQGCSLRCPVGLFIEPDKSQPAGRNSFHSGEGIPSLTLNSVVPSLSEIARSKSFALESFTLRLKLSRARGSGSKAK